MRRSLVCGAVFGAALIGGGASTTTAGPGGGPLSDPDFERGLEGWTKTGTAFDSQPTLGDNVRASRVGPVSVGGDYWTDLPYPIGMRGKYWIGTHEKRPNDTVAMGTIQGDEPTGTLTSARFRIPADVTHITFLIGGGEDIAKLKIELLVARGDSLSPVSGAPAKTGHNSEVLRRDWWTVSSLGKANEFAIRVTDAANGAWGHINIDDIRFEKGQPPDLKLPGGYPAVLRTTLKGKAVWSDYDAPLWGAADLHTHLMSHLAMGKKVMHGAPDVGSLIPAGTKKVGNGCNDRDLRATSVAEALGNCDATHGGWGTDNTCGNHLRAAVLNLGFDSAFEHKIPMPHDAQCAPALENDGGLCYPRCNPGSNGVGPLCYKACPAGFRTDPMHCAKPGPYTRKGYPVGVDIYSKKTYGNGNGYSWDPFKGSLSNGMDRCRNDHPQGCYEGSPSIWYPNCQDGYRGVGLVCYEFCRAGYHDDGLTCRRDGMAMAREACGRENPQGCEDWGGMAYGKCRPGYHAVGCCVCSPDCPAGMPDIGVSCERTYGRGVGKPPVSNVHGDHPHAGFPAFAHWPHYSSITHQQMFVDWIRRAHDGGLNVLVALSVNNHVLGEIVGGDEPKDDKGTGDLQIDEIRSFVGRHSDFMSLVLTPADFRRAIRNGKLAVIVGMEVDNFGNFNYANVVASEDAVKREVQRLHAKGVRYMFPLHFADSKLGGVAVYEDMTNLASKFARSRPLPIEAPIPGGLLYDVEPTRDALVTFRLGGDLALPFLSNAGAGAARGIFTAIEQIPWPPAFDALKCPIPRLGCIPQFKLIKNLVMVPDPLIEKYARIRTGHVNVKGLTALGKVAIKEMWRLGMIVDVDHMSQKTADAVLRLAKEQGMPVSSGHNGVRGPGSNENSRTESQLEILSGLGSVMGIGWADGSTANYLASYRKAIAVQFGSGPIKVNNIGFTLGSDINGFEEMPHPRSKETKPEWLTSDQWASRVCYGPRTGCLTKYRMAGTAKEWDFNQDGVAHIGLYPDAYQDLKNIGMTIEERTEFFGAADSFARMWDAIDARKSSIR